MTNIVAISESLPSTATGYVDAFLASLDVREITRNSYRVGLENFCRWLNAQGVTEPTRETIVSYKRHLIENYTAGTASVYLTAVRSFFAYLEAEHHTPDICRGIRGARQPKMFKKDCLSPEQTRELLAGMPRETLEEKRNFALVNLLIRTGLRTIEAARADVGDIECKGGSRVLKIQGKGRDSKDAVVVLTEATERPIREYLKARGRVPASAPLFASVSNRNADGRLSTRSISGIAKTALREFGLDSDRLTAHSLRHTAVTMTLLGGGSIQDAQTLARHANLNTTLIYAHNINRISNAPERYIDSVLAA